MKRGKKKQTQKILIIALSAVLFLELILVADQTVLTGNPVLKTIERGVESLGSKNLNFKIEIDKSALVTSERSLKDSNWDEIKIKGFEYLAFGEEFEGKPQLPERIYNYILPEGKSAKELKINSVKFEEVSLENKVLPTPRNIKTCEDCEGSCDFWCEPDEKIYSQDSFYPENYIEIISEQDAGGYKIVQIAFRPVQYNPVQNKLKLINHLNFDIVLEEKSVSKLDYRKLEDLSSVIDNKETLNELKSRVPAEKDFGQNYFDSYSSPEYLIITNDELK